MGWKLLFRPKPRCLRDKLELWLVGSKRGQFYYVNLAGMIPFAAVPVGIVIGLIVSFLMDKNLHTGWHLPVRYVPLLLGPGLAAIIGRIVAGTIIDGYYIDHSPYHDNAIHDAVA